MLFYVENARVDCQFALVNGGSQFPLVAGLSNPIKFKSPSIPLGVRRLFFYIKFLFLLFFFFVKKKNKKNTKLEGTNGMRRWDGASHSASPLSGQREAPLSPRYVC